MIKTDNTNYFLNKWDEISINVKNNKINACPFKI